MAQLGVEETMRILLVGEKAATRTELEAALASAVDRYRIDWVSQPELSPVRAKDVLPHLILLDDALADSDLSLLIHQLNAAVPEAPVLALIAGGNVEQVKQAVLAGARGFVNTPIASDDLIATLSRLLLQPHSPSDPTVQRKNVASGHVVAFCSGKGGTGCSTLMVNNAIALHKMTRQSVTVVDANFRMPALHILLNLLDLADISDLVNHLPRIENAQLDSILSPHTSGIRVLQAPLPGATATLPDPSQIQQILVTLKRNADWVFVDLGVPGDDTSFAILDAAERIVVSLFPEMTSLHTAQLLLDRLRDRGYAEGKIWLTLNRSTMRPSVSKSEIEHRLRLRIQHTIPDDQPLTSYSVNRGIPLVSSHEQSALAKSMVALARHLSEDARTVARPIVASETVRSNPFQRWMRGTQAVSV